ncbi:MAG: Peptide deformylase [candidate division WS6 bacterium GW2011_GWA2_37_6]|uniref:Peptide deformylase n=1 Tax=candidate division WS6 bacterium GW2011_GWA2_37_6 TaxID=1619087 RepID=A0A0G0GZE8_9BACT|nr:MAG: Peptide deformylase [candidate division WS6 bacterium GW2011_GWA2_37_6]
MKLKVVQIGDPVLETVAKEVKDFKDPEIQKLIDNLLDTCNSEIERTAGLSAPQVGKSLRISICRRFDIDEDSKEWEVMINPEITSKSGEKSIVWEGCLSIGVGDNALYGPVARSKRIKVKYFDRDGKPKQLPALDYFSHVVQHEIDHLNGILFLKYIKNPDKNLWTSKELDKYIDRHGQFPDIE